MEFLLYFIVLIVGGLLISVTTAAATYYVGGWAFLGTFVGLGMFYLLIASFIDLKIVPFKDSDAIVQSRRREQNAIDRAEAESRDAWGAPDEILWIHGNNPDFRSHIPLRDEQYLRIVQGMTEVIAWCGEHNMEVRRFMWSKNSEEYSTRLKLILKDYDPTKNYSTSKITSYYDRLAEIEHMAPRPHFAFRSENEAIFFKMRWL